MPATSGDVALTVRRLPDGRGARRWLLDTQLHLRRHGIAAWLIRILWFAGLLVALAACLGVAELRGRWEPSRTDIPGHIRGGRTLSHPTSPWHESAAHMASQCALHSSVS